MLSSAERAVLVAAVALRVAALASLAQTPYADAPLVDAYTYWSQAKQLMEGGDPFPQGFYQPPAYPVLLWGLFSLFGDTSPWIPRVFQAGLGVLTTGLVILLGRRWGPERWGGWVAGAIYTGYASALLFEGDLLTPAVSAALITGALVALAPAAISWRRAGAGGLLLGAAASFHPTALLALPAAAWVTRGRGARAALALGCGLALAPTTGANLYRFGELSLVSQNAGLNFYLGNNPDWRETSSLRAGLAFRRLVLEADPARRDTTFARDAYWWSRSGVALRDHPLAFADALATKAVWSVNRREIPRNEDYRCRTQLPSMTWISALPIQYAWVFPLAALGGGAGGGGGGGGGGAAAAGGG